MKKLSINNVVAFMLLIVCLFFTNNSISQDREPQQRYTRTYYVLMDDQTVYPYARIDDYGLKVCVKDENGNYLTGLNGSVILTSFGTTFYAVEYFYGEYVLFTGLAPAHYDVNIYNIDVGEGYKVAPYYDLDYYIESYYDNYQTKYRKVYILTLFRIVDLFPNLK